MMMKITNFFALEILILECTTLTAVSVNKPCFEGCENYTQRYNNDITVSKDDDIFCSQYIAMNTTAFIYDGNENCVIFHLFLAVKQQLPLLHGMLC